MPFYAARHAQQKIDPNIILIPFPLFFYCSIIAIPGFDVAAGLRLIPV